MVFSKRLLHGSARLQVLVVVASLCAGGLIGASSAETPWWVSDARNVDADYIVITPEIFAAEAQLWCEAMDDLRGLRAVTMTLAEIRTAFPGAIPDSADTAAIREALAFAYTNWRSTPLFALLLGDAAESQPQFDFVPTPHFDQGVHGGWCDGTYAMDAWYGDVVPSTDERREIAIGRLPVRTLAQAHDYREKLYLYAGLQSAQPRAGFVVGDLSLVQDNHNRRPAAQRLMRYIRSISDLDTLALYSYDFSAIIPPAGDYLPEEVGAGRDLVIDLIDGGLGIVEFFGNTLPADAVTHTLYYDLNPHIPQFRAALLANRFLWPFAIFSHCKVGAFDEYPSLGISPVEDFVLAPEKGAIAALGKGQMTYHEADEPISHCIYSALLDGGGGSCIGLQVNHALESYLNSPLASRPETIHTARMVNLIGDPALILKLGQTAQRLAASFETGGALPLQDRLTSRASWIASNLEIESAQARVVHAGAQPLECAAAAIEPIEGQRLLGICALHAADGERCKAAWTICARHPSQPEPLLRLRPENAGQAILSFWVRQEAGIAGRGRAFVDLIAANGVALSSAPDAFNDQYGTDYRAGLIDYDLGEWTHIWVRLDAWAQAGVAIDSIAVRYEDERGGGSVAAFVDALHIGEWRADPWGCESRDGGGSGLRPREMIINGKFERDENDDGRPDFWTGPYPDLAAPPAGMRWFDDGEPVFILDENSREVAGLTQLLPRAGHAGCFNIRIAARGWGGGDGDEMAVRLRDMDNGGDSCAERVLLIPAQWENCNFVLRGEPGRLHLLEIEALSGAIMLGDVSVTPCTGTDAPEESSPRYIDRTLRLEPMPTAGRITLSLNSAGPLALRLLTAEGRCAGTARYELSQQSHTLNVDLDRIAAGRLATGFYLLEVADGDSVRRRRILLLR